jgi:NTE family protein
MSKRPGSVSRKVQADPPTELNSPVNATLVFSGGMGLGAYHAGAFEALQDASHIRPNWFAGSSVGAVTAALIAGCNTDPVDALRQFWAAGSLWTSPVELPHPFAHAQNWLSVLQTRLFGATGHFRPRLRTNPVGPFQSLYDLWPMKDRLGRLIDFGRLNSGEARLSVATTDIVTGELVIFDTAQGCRIGMDHILASCGFLPEFAPVEIDGRLLGDGGLSANAPIEAVLKPEGKSARASLVFVLDLFASDGRRPSSFEDALARKNDLLFGNQTLRRLEAYSQTGNIDPVIYLRYRPSAKEAGPEKTFDLSRSSIDHRWLSGRKDMQQAISLASTDHLGPLTLISEPISAAA